MKSGKTSVFRQPKVDFDPNAYETRQQFFTSRDGTKVPMFIVSKKGIKLDGSNPTYLYGYGGFNISLTPGFSPANLAWMEMGGVYVVANLRGGGEYGEAWHQAGTKLQKQNVFDDFIAAAEWLVANKVTSPGEAGDRRRQQRRPAGGRGDDPAAGPVRRGAPGGRRDGHAALPQVHHRLGLDLGLRLGRQPGRVQGAASSIRRCTTSKPGTAYPATW